jgi:phosphopantothenoylcysteine synthetase/decarboxylase
MKIPAIGFLIGAMSVGFADTLSSTIVHANTCALTILGWTIWYLLARAMPAMRREHAAERQQMRKEFLKELRTITRKRRRKS